MGAHQDFVQRAVVLAVAVIGALLHGAFDALVGIAVHGDFLLLFEFGISMAPLWKNNRGKNYLFIAFSRSAWYDKKNICACKSYGMPRRPSGPPVSVFPAITVNL